MTVITVSMAYNSLTENVNVTSYMYCYVVSFTRDRYFTEHTFKHTGEIIIDASGSVLSVNT